MFTIPNYQISTKIYESANSIIYRATRIDKNQPVILKILKEEYPTPEELTRYRQEYEIISRLAEIDGVINVYDLFKHQNQLVICLEDFEAKSVKMWRDEQRTFTLDELLRFAISATDILGQIHGQNIIHKDINPSNFVFNLKTGVFKIIDFGISTQLSKQYLTLKNPNVLEGTLAYISPEQTGRMNRTLDYRTDFYSLGATFYELFTGKVPFESTEAMELVHCHIAKQPLPPSEVNPDIPPAVSNIILKLLEKTAENRYQSAWGLKTDLQNALKQWQAHHTVSTFPLARFDISGHFQIPQKLYGRDNEVQLLLQAFERVSLGEIEMVLVAGYSGIGKSALVHEIHKPITERRGYFSAGKFDQFQKNIPYYVITQAFNEFCRYLLMESTQTLALWKTKILNAVGDNGQILIEIIPDLELVIGQQPPVAEVGPQEAQNRFNLFFLNFVKVISDKKHPFVLFIDDLQWVDSASLALLKTLMLDSHLQYLLIIGAYRDNEVDSTHPFLKTVYQFQQAGISINTIELTNLQAADVNQLLQESLSCEASQSQALTELVYQKTLGNAFFTRQFLLSLYEEKLLRFDSEQRQWIGDIAQIKSQNITSNVVELMANKINRLSKKTQAILQKAACLSNQFDLSVLAIIDEQDKHETLLSLWEAIIEGLLVPLDDNYKHLDTDKKAHFKFLHDRVQQAAYSLIPESNKHPIHLSIGRLLLANTSEQQLNEQIFDIVNQFNQGIELMTDPNEKIRIAQLNLIAGKKAKDSAAYHQAFDYCHIGIDLVEREKEVWERQYDLMLELHITAVETASICGYFEDLERLFQIVVQKAQTIVDKTPVYQSKIQSLMAAGKVQEALKKTLKILELLGEKFPAYPTLSDIQQGLEETQAHYADQPIEHLLDLPEMIDANKIATMRILVQATSPAYVGRPELFPLIMCKGVNLSIQYGNAPESTLAYACYALILCGREVGDIEHGYQFGKLAVDVLEKLQASKMKPNVFEVVNTHVWHFKKPLRETLPPLEIGYQSGRESGNLEYSSYNALIYACHAYFAGKELGQLEPEMAAYNESIMQRVEAARRLYGPFWQAVLNLLGQSEAPCLLIGKGYDQKKELPVVQKTHNQTALGFVYVNTLILCYLFEEYEPALENAKLVEKHQQGLVAMYAVQVWFFYESLTRLALHDSITKDEQNCFLEKVIANQKEMKNWADHAPMNNLHKWHLVEAEYHRVLGHDTDTILEHYEQAIALAKTHEYIQEAALANELLAKFWLAKKNKEKYAKVHLLEARYLYQQWGAVAKVADLEQRYPSFLANKTATSAHTMTTTASSVTLMASTSTTYSNWLDLISVLKASQTLSGEIVLSNLLTKMMDIVIENAGAEKGFLLLPEKEQWFIEAESHVQSQQVNVLQSTPLAKHQQIPITLIHYVARTKEDVVLDNASVEGQFHHDPYIIEYHPKSVLSVPLINQGRLAGILYLENNLTEGAFTPDRLQVLQVLSSQIAISIENALLYRTLEQKVDERTVQLADANQQIMALNEQLKSENLRMSAELDVSRKLQQMLLPREEELTDIPDLEIAGFMEPADEVGGDYYDVLQHHGRILFGIGDVTGHGLESGVIAIMVQAVIRGLLINNETDPVKFLSTLNQSVYSNVMRMESDKSLTLGLLEYQDKMLYLSGQHEEIIVVRQGELELIDTFDLGFTLGLEQEIANYVNQVSLSLNRGDVVVLYTDGVTEAENIAGELYGLERLCEVIQQNWQQTAQQIQQIVVDDVRQFIGKQTVFDDITLLVLKQK